MEVCIFTYGQTGSGKTYTMLGGEGGGGAGDDEDCDEMEAEEEAEREAAAADGGKNSDRGLIPRSIEQIFAARDAVRRCASRPNRFR